MDNNPIRKVTNLIKQKLIDLKKPPEDPHRRLAEQLDRPLKSLKQSDGKR